MQSDNNNAPESDDGASVCQFESSTNEVIDGDGPEKNPSEPEADGHADQQQQQQQPLGPVPVPPPMPLILWLEWWSLQRRDYTDEDIFIGGETRLHVAPPKMVLTELRMPVLPEKRMLVAMITNLRGSKTNPFAVCGTLPYQSPDGRQSYDDVYENVEYYQRSVQPDTMPIDVLRKHLLKWHTRLDWENRNVMLLLCRQWNAHVDTIYRTTEIPRITLVVIPDIVVPDGGCKPFWMADTLDSHLPPMFEFASRLFTSLTNNSECAGELSNSTSMFAMENTVVANSRGPLLDPEFRACYLSLKHGLIHLDRFWDICSNNGILFRVYVDYGKLNLFFN